MRFLLAGVAVWMSVASSTSLAASFPEHAMADSGRLLSRVAPVSGKGSPAQQTRQAIDALWKRDRDAQIVKLRVFVNDPSVSSAVSTAIAEAFQKKHAALPVVSLIRVAALPAGASVAVEATSLAKRDVNPQGIGFIDRKSTRLNSSH